MAKIDLLKEVKTILSQDTDFLKPLLKELLNELLEAEMSETIGATSYQRCDSRLGHRAGYYNRKYITRVGSIDLRVPRDREGRFSTELFERYQRSEKALLATLAEMYIRGVSTRKIGAITEELCGHKFSASTVSNINKTLDEHLNAFSHRQLVSDYPYVILDARYEKVRENGAITSQAILIAIGITQEGKKEFLGVELAHRESRTTWKDFLVSLRNRGLQKVRFIVSDSHDGLKKAIGEVMPESIWQRCYVHFLRNAIDYLPKKNDGVCLQGLKSLYDRTSLEEAHKGMTDWIAQWEKKHPKLCAWVEENIMETFSFYRIPPQHHKLMRSTNFLERINQEVKRRTRVVRIFPNAESCLRLIRALVIEMHEEWLVERKCLNMMFLEELKQEPLEKKVVA